MDRNSQLTTSYKCRLVHRIVKYFLPFLDKYTHTVDQLQWLKLTV